LLIDNYEVANQASRINNEQSTIKNQPLMSFKDFDNFPFGWADHEDIAMAL